MTTTTSTLRKTDGNWIIGAVGPFEVEAKAFEDVSGYGMAEDGRISKLWVALPGTPRVVLYDYDRGDLVKDHLTVDGLAEIVAAVADLLDSAAPQVADCDCRDCLSEVKW